MLLWTMGLLVGEAAAQGGDACTCTAEDPATVFSRAREVYIARSGDVMQNELTPMVSLKGVMPERAYVAETWRECDLLPGAPGQLMLVAVEPDGHMSRCNGSGPLPMLSDAEGEGVRLGLQEPLTDADLREWLRLGGWSDERLPEELVKTSIRRELDAHPLMRGEDGVAISGYTGLEYTQAEFPIRSLAARVEGPRWMSLEALRGPSKLFYVGWQQEATVEGQRAVWESHSLWQETSAGVVSVWRHETPPLPVLDAAPGERVATEALVAAPSLSAFPGGGALVVVPGPELYALALDPQRGWLAPETLGRGEASQTVAVASAEDAAVAVWLEEGALRARRYTPQGGWADPERLAEAPAQEPRLTMNERGEALLVWRGLGDSLWLRTMSAGGAWSRPVEVAPPGAREPHAVLGPGGHALLVWIEGGAVRARRTNRRGQWSSVRALSYGEQASAPRAAVDRLGRALVVWIEGEGTKRELYARDYLPLRGWGADPDKLLTNRRGAAGMPEVVMSSTNGATIFWLQQGTRSSMWARRYTLRRGWSNPEQVTLLDEADDQRPAAVLHRDGTISLAWTGSGSGWTVRYMPGHGFLPFAAIEEDTRPVRAVTLDAYDESAVMFLWTQGERDPLQVWVREVP